MPPYSDPIVEVTDRLARATHHVSLAIAGKDDSVNLADSTEKSGHEIARALSGDGGGDFPLTRSLDSIAEAIERLADVVEGLARS